MSPPTTLFALFLALKIHAAGDEDARIENLELAIESMHNALAI